MKIKEILFLIIFVPLLVACPPEDGWEEDLDVQELNTVVTFDVIPPNSGPTAGTADGAFNDVFWDENAIYLGGSDNPALLEWIIMGNLNLIGTGQYQLLNSPNAEGMFNGKMYSTEVSPDFWLNQGSNVNQGGYLNITEYSSNAISGDFYFIAWRWDNLLNREVGFGVSGKLQDIPKS